MSESTEPDEKPEPHLDAPPDEGPGGPADVVRRDADDFPLATPDQPRSAQVEDKCVPDEIEELENVDEDEQDTEAKATDEPA